MTARHRWTPAFAILLAAALAGCADTGDEAATDEMPAVEAGAVADTAAVMTEAETTTALVNPNEAAEEELRTLPGLDSATVAMIVEQRPFDDMMALHSALGSRMDSTALDALYREMFIPLDVSTASREAILLIPGVGPRMAAEFLEYQPYEGGLAEFRQEIGKYVDESEVSRLERYVTFP